MVRAIRSDCNGYFGFSFEDFPRLEWQSDTTYTWPALPFFSRSRSMSNAHEHLEHAEHAGHAADPFDRRVAVSVAVVAALLAGISMLGHRKHNEVLQLQGDANRLTTQASILHTQA